MMFVIERPRVILQVRDRFLHIRRSSFYTNPSFYAIPGRSGTHIMVQPTRTQLVERLTQNAWGGKSTEFRNRRKHMPEGAQR